MQIYLFYNLFVAFVLDCPICDSSNVAEQVLVTLRGTIGEEAAAIDCAESHDPLRPGMQLPKACRIDVFV